MSVIPEPPAQTGEPVASGASGGEDQLAVPASPGVLGREGVLGLRITAALIDLAVLLGLFIVVVLALGEFSLAGGRFTLHLGSAGVAVYVALVLLYYLVLEAVFGQTVGKHLLGLRVRRPDRSQPPAQASEPSTHVSAGRENLLGVRIGAALIDLAMLVGLFVVVALIIFVVPGETLVRTMLWVDVALVLLYYVALEAAFGQTVGQVLLGLRVMRPDRSQPPARHRGITATLLAVLLLVVVVVAVQQPAVPVHENGIYREHGVSFDYPADWRETSLEGGVTAGDANELWGTAVGPITGEFDLVIIEAYQVGSPVVTADDMGAVMLKLVSLVQQLAEQVEGVVEAGPQEFTMAGLPGLRFQITGTADGTALRSTLSFVFDGTTEYFVNCQHTPGGFAEIQQGCDQITRTFTVNP